MGSQTISAMSACSGKLMKCVCGPKPIQPCLGLFREADRQDLFREADRQDLFRDADRQDQPYVVLSISFPEQA